MSAPRGPLEWIRPLLGHLLAGVLAAVVCAAFWNMLYEYDRTVVMEIGGTRFSAFGAYVPLGGLLGAWAAAFGRRSLEVRFLTLLPFLALALPAATVGREWIDRLAWNGLESAWPALLEPRETSCVLVRSSIATGACRSCRWAPFA